MNFNADIQKIARQFIPINLSVTTWDDLKPYFVQLQENNISDVIQLQNWLAKVSELQAVISEDACWRQIKMTCDTTDKALEDAYTFWCTDIQPHISEASNLLNEKLLAHPCLTQLDEDKYGIYIRGVRTAASLFRAENVALQSEESVLGQQFGSVSSKMTIEVNGETFTMQQGAKFLMQSDRNLRKEVFDKMASRRLQDKEVLDELMNKLIAVRHQIALNAGFENYRDYKFKELGRFDYNVADCEAFHNAVKKYILPLCDKIYISKAKYLGLDQLAPYDVDAEPEGVTPLQPFAGGEDLSKKSIAVFDELGSFFGDCLRKMQIMQHLDLDSRIGKAPGGYNCPLAETGVPFIFMNAAGTADDVVTMMHEGGHAVHSFVCHDLQLSGFKEYPMEMAELASMSMELFTMEHWHYFYNNQTDLNRAKAEELERVLTILPWIAIVDKFQHWLYTNPSHTIAERTTAWQTILAEFSTNTINYSGYELSRANSWQKQLHIFEVPFYYIEYGIAQLGAIAMWQQYQQNKQQALDNYLQALSLGYTKDLKSLYQTAGIAFDFSEQNIEKLSIFIEQEINKFKS
jgi:oligoendopeptidase F